MSRPVAGWLRPGSTDRLIPGMCASGGVREERKTGAAATERSIAGNSQAGATNDQCLPREARVADLPRRGNRVAARVADLARDAPAAPARPTDSPPSRGG